MGTDDLTASQQALVDVWEWHMAAEFETKSIDATMATMSPNPFVNHVPVMTGGVGHDEAGQFYLAHFIPAQAVDTEIVPVVRTVGTDRNAMRLPATAIESSRKVVNPAQEPSNRLIDRVT